MSALQYLLPFQVMDDTDFNQRLVNAMCACTLAGHNHHSADHLSGSCLIIAPAARSQHQRRPVPYVLPLVTGVAHIPNHINVRNCHQGHNTYIGSPNINLNHSTPFTPRYQCCHATSISGSMNKIEGEQAGKKVDEQEFNPSSNSTTMISAQLPDMSEESTSSTSNPNAPKPEVSAEIMASDRQASSSQHNFPQKFADASNSYYKRACNSVDRGFNKPKQVRWEDEDSDFATASQGTGAQNGKGKAKEPRDFDNGTELSRDDTYDQDNTFWRQLDSLKDALKSRGLKVVDNTGSEVYDPDSLWIEQTREGEESDWADHRSCGGHTSFHNPSEGNFGCSEEEALDLAPEENNDDEWVAKPRSENRDHTAGCDVNENSLDHDLMT